MEANLNLNIDDLSDNDLSENYDIADDLSENYDIDNDDIADDDIDNEADIYHEEDITEPIHEPVEIDTDLLQSLNQSQSNNSGYVGNSYASNTDKYQKYQNNVSMVYKKFAKNLEFTFKALPLTFFLDYSEKKAFENSKKIIVPKSFLYELSNYEDLELPIFVKINDIDILFGIAEYVDYVDHVYIPTKTFFEFDLEENCEIQLTILKARPPNATSISIKPLSEEFYLIPNIKNYLEIMMKKMVISLTLGEIVRLPFADKWINIEIKELQPEPVVSLFDLESVDITVLPMVEPSCKLYNNKKEEENESKGDETEPKDEDNYEIPNVTEHPQEPYEFVPFSGKGHTLGS